MKLLGYLLGACVVLAIVRALAVAIVFAAVLAFLVGFISKPREMLGLFGFVVIADIVAVYPLFSLTLVSLVVVNHLMRSR
jgi:ABC-type multidrug transport system permease subunit